MTDDTRDLELDYMKSRFTLTIETSLLKGLRKRAKQESRKISQMLEVWIRHELAGRSA